MISLQESPDPLSSRGPELHFIIGQDETGEWLALESHGLIAGLFKSQADAVHFARLECGRREGAIELSQAPIQLKFPH